jgi:hypothetical protein
MCQTAAEMASPYLFRDDQKDTVLNNYKHEITSLQSQYCKHQCKTYPSGHELDDSRQHVTRSLPLRLAESQQGLGLK